jgi:predicted nucleic acid-binding protein
LSYVLDASAGVELLLETSIGAVLQPKLPAGIVWVPETYFAEVAGALRRLELAGTITAQRAAAALDELLAAPIRRAAVKPLLSEAWTLRHNVTIADAIYVVLARHSNSAVVTTDHRLASAPELGVLFITD